MRHLARGARLLGPALLGLAVLLGPTALPTAAQTASPTTIKFWYMPNGGDPDGAVQTEIAAFNQVHPEISVDAQAVDWGSALTRITAGIQGGEAPCVTQVGTTWVPGFSAMGGLRPFTADEVAAMGGASNFVPAAWATAGLAGSSDVTAVPWFADVRALAYRQDILAETGLTPDQAFRDWPSFENTLARVKQVAPDMAPFIHPGKNDWNVWQNTSMWIWNAGGELLSPDYTQAVFNSPAAVAGVSEFTSLYTKGLTSSDTLELNSNQTDQKFGDGKAFAEISGPWLISFARSDPSKGGWSNDVVRQNMAFAEFPSGPGGNYTFVGGSNLAVLNSCPDPAAAVAFVEYLVSPESQVRYTLNIGMLPATQQAEQDGNFVNDPLFQPFLSAAAKGKTSAPIPQWSQIEPTLQDQLQAVWDDLANNNGQPLSNEQIQTRLDAAARAVNGYLAAAPSVN